jgi:hypothetical protein
LEHSGDYDEIYVESLRALTRSSAVTEEIAQTLRQGNGKTKLVVADMPGLFDKNATPQQNFQRRIVAAVCDSQPILSLYVCNCLLLLVVQIRIDLSSECGPLATQSFFATALPWVCQLRIPRASRDPPILCLRHLGTQSLSDCSSKFTFACSRQVGAKEYERDMIVERLRKGLEARKAKMLKAGSTKYNGRKSILELCPNITETKKKKLRDLCQSRKKGRAMGIESDIEVDRHYIELKYKSK